MARILRAADRFGKFMDNPVSDRCLIGLYLLGTVMMALAGSIPS